MEIRRATWADEDRATAALCTGFAGDPLWGWALPDAATRDPFWRFFVRAGLGRDAVWVVDDARSVAIWAEPGAVELDADGERAFGQLCQDLLGAAGAARVAGALDALAAVHPNAPPNHYLSLLATHDDHRGHGLAMTMVADYCARLDATGEPAYLESSNPANLARYGRAGFEPRDEVTLSGGQVVTTMWRAPRAPAGGSGS
jgi:GNAT superfamily N-acetyltransferase